jgi:hypothetical protein
MPMITGALDAGHRVTRQRLLKTPSTPSRVGTRKAPARLAPKKVSVAGLPVTGSDLFGREEDIAFWIVHGQTRMSTSLQSLLGLVSESPHSSTIGSDGWLQTIIVLQSEFLVGLFTDRVPLGTLRPRMNFLMLLLTGLAIQIQASERPGRKAKDWLSSSRIVEPYWFWTAWSCSKIRLVHKKDGYGSLHSRRFCVNSPPSIRDFA